MILQQQGHKLKSMEQTAITGQSMPEELQREPIICQISPKMYKTSSIMPKLTKGANKTLLHYYRRFHKSNSGESNQTLYFPQETTTKKSFYQFPNNYHDS